jgi:hypothetical protein
LMVSIVAGKLTAVFRGLDDSHRGRKIEHDFPRNSPISANYIIFSCESPSGRTENGWPRGLE